jgi:IstB-like ATP binding protein
MRRYERASTLLTSNRPVEDWGKLLGDSAAVAAMLDRLLHHGHVLKCGPRSWRTKTGSVIGPGSLRRARPRRSDYNANTQSKRSDHQRATLCLANLHAGKVK